MGLVAVLVHKLDLGTKVFIAFASRSLNTAERNYSATELEYLTVVWVLEKWRVYLEDQLFTITTVTDHASFLWVFKTTKHISSSGELSGFGNLPSYIGRGSITSYQIPSPEPAEGLQLFIPVCATIMSTSMEPSTELPVSIEAI